MNGSKDEWKNKGYSFFQSTSCEYFPCHGIRENDLADFNCLFCFCPLYHAADCGGRFTFLDNGGKDCSACKLPHQKESYGYIIERLSNKPQ